MCQMLTDGGCNSLKELFCTIKVSSVSKPTFIKIERLLGLLCDQYLDELMLQAGCEEKQIVIQNNNTTMEFAIVDGEWIKRSQKYLLNIHSDVGVIFRATTKKLLYMGIKNKYCAVCSNAQRKGLKQSHYMCFNNWAGSSIFMEPDIITSGF